MCVEGAGEVAALEASVDARGRQFEITLLDPGADAKVAEYPHISEAFEHAAEFDLIHSHYDFMALAYTRLVRTPVLTTIQTDPLTHARYLRLTAASGPLHVTYQSVVDIDQHIGNPDLIQETPVSQLPLSVLSYIYPSRYCQSDRLAVLSMGEFGHLPKGYRRVEAIRNWVNKHVAFRSNTSSSTTSALDTVTDRVGVCRDFAHLMIAICRALSIPARFTTGIDYGADPALGPTDFHAYVEEIGRAHV